MTLAERTTSAWLVRARAFVSDNERAVVAALVLLALAGGYLTFATHVDPGTTVETREVAPWESTGEFTHRATVVNGTDAFERGTVLRNRSVYFTTVSPTLDGTFGYEYAADRGDLAVNVSTTLVVRSVAETRSGEETEYWRVERPLGSERVDRLRPGARVEMPFSTNVAAADQRAERIRRQHRASPGQTQLSLVATVDLSGTRNGEQVETTRRYRLPISVDSGVYRVESPGPVTESDTTTERVTVPASHGPVRGLGAPLLLVASLSLLGLVGAARRRGELAVPERERAELEHARERAAFDEWITTGSVPAVARGQSRIAVDSLEGLVDVAIDTNERVLEDRERGEFVVLRDAVTYVYRPPTARPSGVDDEGDDFPVALVTPPTDDAASNGRGPDGVAAAGNVPDAAANRDVSTNGERSANTGGEDSAGDAETTGSAESGTPADRSAGGEEAETPEDRSPDSGEVETPPRSADSAGVETPVRSVGDEAATAPGGPSSDSGAADGTVETVPAPSLAPGDDQGTYHDNDGADADGWLDELNLAGRSRPDD